MRGAAALVLVGLAVAGCSATTTSTPVPHADHDPTTLRVMAALESERGMSFEPAGPHHDLGRAPDGVELDLIGVPVEEVVLSVPSGEPELGHEYLPHLRDLLHGPDRVYDWIAAMLSCRADGDATCQESFEQGNLEARFTDGGPDYVVVSISRGPG